MPSSGGSSGGSSPFVVLGPYTVTYAQLDPVTYVDLVALADGTIVWAVNVFVRTAFTHVNEAVVVKVGTLTDLTDDWNNQPSVFANDKIAVQGALANAHAASDPVAQAAYTINGVQAAPSALFAQHDTHLAVGNALGGNSAGTVDIYALASVPA